MWRQLYETTDDTWVRNNAQLKLSQLQALDEIDALAAHRQALRAAPGGVPRSWSELVADPVARGRPS